MEVRKVDNKSFQSLDKSAKIVNNLAVTPKKFNVIVIGERFYVEPHSKI